MESLTFISKSLGDTFALAKAFSEVLGPESIVFLSGELGAGKTAFVQGIACALGSENPVTSPTFNLMQEYDVPSGQTIFHFDLYRIEDEDELGETGLLDVAGIEGPTFIEWGEPFQSLLGEDFFEIKIERVAKDVNAGAVPEDTNAEAIPEDANADYNDATACENSNSTTTDSDHFNRLFTFSTRGKDREKLARLQEILGSRS